MAKGSKANVIPIAYGKGTIPLYADPKVAEWQIIRPRHEAPLADAQKLFAAACRAPVGCPPLREVVRPNDRVLIVTSDGTRAVPNHLLIPWLLAELPVPAEQVTVMLGTGSHRANTPQEIEQMFGADVVRRVRIVNHDAFDAAQNISIGKLSDGKPARVDRMYVEADKRIVVGFIEPHLFAGYSGGAKGIVPAVAAIDTILHIHRAEVIGHPMSTWGELAQNPIRNEIEAIVAQRPPDFMVNVTLNVAKEISGLYIGHYQEAHRVGCERVRKTAMEPVSQPFPIAVTSNSGYPLDQNVYQAVKGISAAMRIVQPGGTVICASECADGIPEYGNFAAFMHIGKTADDILRHVFSLPETQHDQWEAQTYAYLMQKGDIAFLSKLDPQVIAGLKLRPVADLQAAVEEAIAKVGRGARVAVLPDGPQNIPYLTTKVG
jgi:lactate racemase